MKMTYLLSLFTIGGLLSAQALADYPAEYSQCQSAWKYCMVSLLEDSGDNNDPSTQTLKDAVPMTELLANNSSVVAEYPDYGQSDAIVLQGSSYNQVMLNLNPAPDQPQNLLAVGMLGNTVYDFPDSTSFSEFVPNDGISLSMQRQNIGDPHQECMDDVSSNFVIVQDYKTILNFYKNGVLLRSLIHTGQDLQDTSTACAPVRFHGGED